MSVRSIVTITSLGLITLTGCGAAPDGAAMQDPTAGADAELTEFADGTELTADTEPSDGTEAGNDLAASDGETEEAGTQSSPTEVAPGDPADVAEATRPVDAPPVYFAPPIVERLGIVDDADPPPARIIDPELGPNPDGKTVTVPLDGGGEDPLQCILEETVDALLCGTEVVRDAAECGYEHVRDAARCGTQVVRDTAECGVTTVTSYAECGARTVTSVAECGTKTITSAAECGTEVVTSGAKCGWDFLSSILGGKKPKSCKVAKSCQVAKTCEIAATCQVAASCEVALECDAPKQCEIAKSCDVEICKQHTPGGQCVPGLAECDIEGFACQASFQSDVFRCVPNYDTDLAIQDRKVCESLYEPHVADLATSSGNTVAFSAGASAAAGIATTLEVGTVYGEGGQYGCFATTCLGVQTDAAIADFANLGAYIYWDVFAGVAKTFGVSASIPGIELGVGTTSVLASEYDQYIGQVDTISLGVGVLPAQATAMTCTTTVYQTR